MDLEKAAGDNWEFRVEHKNISVYSAKMTESDILGFKGVVEIPVSLRRLVSLFYDTGSYPRWVHQLASIQVLDKSEELEFVIQQVINVPWPLQRREMIFRTGLEAAGESGVAVTMRSEPDYLPRSSAYTRVREGHGKWIFEPLEDGLVRITFIMYVNPGRDVPTPLVNTAMFEVPFYSLQNLRNLAANQAYDPPYPDEVDDFISISEH